jgi:hypothetical protein
LERGIEEVEIEELGETKVRAFRCSLEEAMKIVVSTDLERRLVEAGEVKREWHDYYQAWLGDEDQLGVKKCLCTLCRRR